MRASRSSFPADIDFTFMQESGTHTSLYDAKGKVDALIEQSRELIEDQRLARPDYQRRAQGSA